MSWLPRGWGTLCGPGAGVAQVPEWVLGSIASSALSNSSTKQQQGPTAAIATGPAHPTARDADAGVAEGRAGGVTSPEASPWRPSSDVNVAQCFLGKRASVSMATSGGAQHRAPATGF